MKMNGGTIIVIAIVVLFYIIKKQLQVKEVKIDTSWTLTLILFAMGINNLQEYMAENEMTQIGWFTLFVNLILLAGGMGVLRAFSMNIWKEDECLFRQGTWVNVVLWIFTTLLHGIMNYIGGSGSATTFLYIAITVFAQNLVISERAKKLVQVEEKGMFHNA